MKKTDLRLFDYKTVGKIDADMWRAYYNHHFFKLFWLLLKLINNQLRLGWLISTRLAYYSAWAAADYRIHRNNVNTQRVLKNVTKFYEIISRHSVEPFDYKRAGELEVAWWEIHRKSYTNNSKLETALADTQATIYNIEVKKLKNYARYRAEAMILPRHKGDSKNNQTDWAKIESMTIKSGQALYSAIN